MQNRIDEKRAHRMKLSKVLHFDCRGLDSPSIKWAETHLELKQAFALVHDEYLKLGYIAEPHPSGMFFGIHNLLPATVTLVVKARAEVVATLTQVPDTAQYGLPMDKIYNRELSALRRKGRKIAELCALVTNKQLRWKNLYMQMSRLMYSHALCNGVDDFCIMVNPKHVAFYQLIFLFEAMGPEKIYPTLGVPAVAMRANLRRMQKQLKEKYGAMASDCNLYEYMHSPLSHNNALLSEDLLPPKRLPPDVTSYFRLEHIGDAKRFATA